MAPIPKVSIPIVKIADTAHIASSTWVATASLARRPVGAGTVWDC